MSCYSCSELLYKIGVNSTIQGIIAIKKYNLLSLWAPGLQFRSPPEITLLSPQSRGTGEYGSTPVVPLKPPFFLSDSFTCSTVRDRHDKRLRFFLWFFSTCLFDVLSRCVFLPISGQNSRFLRFREKI